MAMIARVGSRARATLPPLTEGTGSRRPAPVSCCSQPLAAARAQRRLHRQPYRAREMPTRVPGRSRILGRRYSKPPGSEAQTLQLAQRYEHQHGATVMTPVMPFCDTELIVRKTLAEKHHLITLAQLKGLGPLRLGDYSPELSDPQLLSGKYMVLSDPKHISGSSTWRSSSRPASSSGSGRRSSRPTVNLRRLSRSAISGPLPLPSLIRGRSVMSGKRCAGDLCRGCRWCRRRRSRSGRGIRRAGLAIVPRRACAGVRPLCAALR